MLFLEPLLDYYCFLSHEKSQKAGCKSNNFGYDR